MTETETDPTADPAALSDLVWRAADDPAAAAANRQTAARIEQIIDQGDRKALVATHAATEIPRTPMIGADHEARLVGLVVVRETTRPVSR